MRQFFSGLSYVLHPIFMPILGLMILFWTPTLPYSFKKMDALYYFPDGAKFYLCIIIGILTMVAPLLSLIIMKKNGIVSSMKLENKKERNYPYVITIFYFILAFAYVRYQVPESFKHPALLGFLFSAVIIFITLFITNLYIKVSLHTAGIFGLVGGLLGYFQTQNLIENESFALYFVFLFLGLGGIVAAGRVYLKAHTLGETTLGMLLGFLLAFVSVRYGIYI